MLRKKKMKMNRLAKFQTLLDLYEGGYISKDFFIALIKKL